MNGSTPITVEPGPLVAVLAAGLGMRFGGGKLDAPCAGRRLGEWALAAVAAAGLAPGLIVTGPAPPAFARTAQGWRLIPNPHPKAGLGGSLALAARVALAEARALLVLLADMPLIEPAHLAALAAHCGPAATRHPDGRAGVPALLCGALLEEAAMLSGEGGARALLARMPGLALLDPAPGSLADVDKPAMLAEVAARLSARG